MVSVSDEGRRGAPGLSLQGMEAQGLPGVSCPGNVSVPLTCLAPSPGTFIMKEEIINLSCQTNKKPSGSLKTHK